jgi:hypothetical protein
MHICFIPAKHKRLGYKIKFVHFHKNVIFFYKFYFKGIEVPVRNINVRMWDIKYNVNKSEICSKLVIILKHIFLEGLLFFLFDVDPSI